MGYTRAASLDEVWAGEMAAVTVAGRPVLLINMDGDVRAYENRCPHLGVPLSEGSLAGSRLRCRAHLWEYDACTGKGVNPAGVGLKPLPARLEGNAIFVDVDPGGGHV